MLSAEPHRENRDPIGAGSYGRSLDNYFRTYDPTTGRYLSADPIGQVGGINVYPYTDNNPLFGIDPSGLSASGALPGGWSPAYTRQYLRWLYRRLTAPFRGGSIYYPLDPPPPYYCPAASQNAGSGSTMQQSGGAGSTAGSGGPPDSKTGAPPPDVPPYNPDPNAPPGPGYEWRPKGSQPGGEGSWYDPKTGTSVHPDREHPPPIGPHNDIQQKGNKGPGWRQFPDGTIKTK